jgi:hypothetical protein
MTTEEIIRLCTTDPETAIQHMLALTADLEKAKAAKDLAELHAVDLRTELSRRPPLKDDDWRNFWEGSGIQCGNCLAVMVARGGMEVLSHPEEDGDLAVCGACYQRIDLRRKAA